MGLKSTLNAIRKAFQRKRKPVYRFENSGPRRCQFEWMEERRMLTADPVVVGITYFEMDDGADGVPDQFQITFTGGAAGTELTRLIIDADQFGDGYSNGDMIFDTIEDPNSLGVDHAHPFKIVSNSGITSVKATVVDGGSKLILDFVGFHAGDKLIFSIDVDEVQKARSGDIATQNSGLDPVASGAEFEDTRIEATFKANGYHDVVAEGRFVNAYDPVFAGHNLDLPSDNFDGSRDRSAGALTTAQQLEKPISIEGHVFVDADRDNVRDAGETPLAGVTLSLWRKEGNTYVNTGYTATTDANGRYVFGKELNLLPGVYQIREAQPDGYFSVGAIPGTVEGTTSGVASGTDIITDIVILVGDTESIDNDFGEILPGSIAGKVWSDPDLDRVYDAGDSPIAGVTIELLDANGSVVATTTTNAQGEYRFDNLFPGQYSVRESQPLGYLQGATLVGSGTGVAGLDLITMIDIGSGAALINYNFTEIPPASISGAVRNDGDANCATKEDALPIAGVTIELLNEQGQVVATTVTDANGNYKFDNLAPGRYSVREIQPEGFLTLGQRAGNGNGDASTPNLIRNIDIGAGAVLVEYDFCEILPARIEGYVFVDNNSDLFFDINESPIANVTIELLDAQGNIVATTKTDENGFYQFNNLMPGTYAVREIHPNGYLQGGQIAGSAGGDDSITDLIRTIPITVGADLFDYNFAETLPAQISGYVFVDLNGDMVKQGNEAAIGNVRIELLDAQGNIIAVKHTDSNGYYEFTGLKVGTYAIREIQPTQYFHGGQVAGSGGGDASVDDLIRSISIGSGQSLVHYDFGEILPGALSGYVFQDGDAIVTPDGKPPVDIWNYRDGQFTPDDKPLAGVILELRDGITGKPIDGSQALPGFYPPGPIRTVTDANGFYRFAGLKPGNYAVYQVQPDGYYDGLDTEGTTSGIAINPNSNISPFILQQLAEAPPGNDAIIRIAVGAGIESQYNNFSEILVEAQPPEPPRYPPVPPSFPPGTPPTTNIRVPMPPDLPPTIVSGQGNWTFLNINNYSRLISDTEGGNAPQYTWHLSIVDAGNPRGEPVTLQQPDMWLNASHLKKARWLEQNLRDGRWKTGKLISSPDRSDVILSDEFAEQLFGLPNGIPFAGDFNGDGRAELGVYLDGEWFVDLNGNGKWDPEDLWAKLGTSEDRPVVGDWDGDGKDDIGIYGPEWKDDEPVIEAEPGLPDQFNRRELAHNSVKAPHIKPKNVPPRIHEANDQTRELKRTERGAIRGDLIDHVFRFGSQNDIPVTGDFNGDGIDSIAVFRDGLWRIDVDGDGRLTGTDKIFKFGQPGDIPVVGDFNGDGVDEIGVYRKGQWIIDIDRDLELSAHDKVFELGSEDELPVVGDWDGDGIDDPGVFKPVTSIGTRTASLTE